MRDVRALQLGHFLGGERQFQGSNGVLQMGRALLAPTIGAYQAVGADPCKGELGAGHAAAFGDGAHGVGNGLARFLGAVEGLAELILFRAVGFLVPVPGELSRASGLQGSTPIFWSAQRGNIPVPPRR